MELQIQDLVCAIKKDGVDAAQKEADNIIAEAKSKASAIISEAKEEADRIRKKTENDVEVLKESAKITAEHAKRDATLSFKEAVQLAYEKLLAEDVSKTVNSGVLAQLIIAAMNNEDPSNYAAEVSEISEELKSELAEKVRAGLEIRINPNVHVGFRLVEKDGSGYFDCSDEAITQMLMPFFPDLVISEESKNGFLLLFAVKFTYAQI